MKFEKKRDSKTIENNVRVFNGYSIKTPQGLECCDLRIFSNMSEQFGRKEKG